MGRKGSLFVIVGGWGVVAPAVVAEGIVGGGLLGEAFAASFAVAGYEVAEEHFDDEGAVVGGAGFAGDAVGGGDAELSLRQLLEQGFVVLHGGVFCRQVDELVAEEWFQKGAGGGYAAILIERADQGLEGAGQQEVAVASAGDFLAAPQAEVAAKGERAGECGKGGGADEGGAQICQVAFGGGGEAGVEQVGGDEAEHGVTQKFQPLV